MKLLFPILWSLVFGFGLLFGTQADAQGNYQVKPGDTLRIEVLEDPTLNRNVLVLPDGRFSFPFAGTVRAGGLSINQITRAVTSGIASNFALEPSVFVSVVSLQPAAPRQDPLTVEEVTIDVYFLGEVNSPGVRNLKPGTTILQAFAQAGGFTRFAAIKRIQLRRNEAGSQQQVYSINYKALSNGAAIQQDIVLQNGDVVLVPERRLFE